MCELNPNEIGNQRFETAKPLECGGFDAAFPFLRFVSGGSESKVAIAESNTGKAASKPPHSKGFADPESSC
jgi:hypothetical protein